MPRSARLDARPPRLSEQARDGGQAPGTLHHIIVRGIERCEAEHEGRSKEHRIKVGLGLEYSMPRALCPMLLLTAWSIEHRA